MSNDLTFDEKIMLTQITIGDETVIFRELFGIDPDNIEDALTKHSARMAYVQMMAADAKHDYEQAKHDAKVTTAETYEEIRTATMVKMTEKALGNAALIDEGCVSAKETEYAAQLTSEQLDAMGRSLYQHGELLKILGSK